MINKVTLIGNVGQSPEVRSLENGKVATFSLATTEKGYTTKDGKVIQDKTEWHRIVAWRQTAEFVGNYLSKGRLVMVEGKLQTRKWQDQNGQDKYSTEIVADNIQSLDRAPEGQFRQQGQQQGQQQGGYQQNNNQPQGQQGGYQQDQPQQQEQQAAQPTQQPEEDLGPAFPSEASGMDDVPF